MQIRQITHLDIDAAAKFLQLMMTEMVGFGGPSVQDPDHLLEWFQGYIQRNFNKPDHVFFIAESGAPSPEPLGILEASINTCNSPFLPSTSLHIHSIFVDPDKRRSGIAQKLFEVAFEWGRENDCTEVDLHVLIESPAKLLYERLGFEDVQVEMRRKLQ